MDDNNYEHIYKDLRAKILNETLGLTINCQKYSGKRIRLFSNPDQGKCLNGSKMMAL